MLQSIAQNPHDKKKIDRVLELTNGVREAVEYIKSCNENDEVTTRGETTRVSSRSNRDAEEVIRPSESRRPHISRDRVVEREPRIIHDRPLMPARVDPLDDRDHFRNPMTGERVIRRIHRRQHDDFADDDLDYRRRDRGFEINGVDEPRTMKELEDQQKREDEIAKENLKIDNGAPEPKKEEPKKKSTRRAPY